MILAAVSVLLNALAQISIKSLSAIHVTSFIDYLKTWQLYATGGLYLISVLTWFFALKTLPLNIAYPLQAGGYVLVSLLAWLLFKEQFGLTQLIALTLISAGVALLAFGNVK